MLQPRPRAKETPSAAASVSVSATAAASANTSVLTAAAAPAAAPRPSPASSSSPIKRVAGGPQSKSESPSLEPSTDSCTIDDGEEEVHVAVSVTEEAAAAAVAAAVTAVGACSTSAGEAEDEEGAALPALPADVHDLLDATLPPWDGAAALSGWPEYISLGAPSAALLFAGQGGASMLCYAIYCPPF